MLTLTGITLFVTSICCLKANNRFYHDGFWSLIMMIFGLGGGVLGIINFLVGTSEIWSNIK